MRTVISSAKYNGDLERPSITLYHYPAMKISNLGLWKGYPLPETRHIPVIPSFNHRFNSYSLM